MTENPKSTPDFTLRPATKDDEQMCYEIHRTAMHDVVDQVFGWDEDFQRAMWAREWVPEEFRIILIDGKDVGSIDVVEDAKSIRLTGFELRPEFQGLGIGTRILRILQSQAAGRGVPLLLGVFIVNSRAKALYERMGFEEIGRSEIKIDMRWDPEM
ncbi:hypothetical protein OQA88_8007 [Cercophora sp. LCS_1]